VIPNKNITFRIISLQSSAARLTLHFQNKQQNQSTATMARIVPSLTLLLLTLCTLLLTTPTQAYSEWDYTVMKYSCMKKDWRIVNAIDALCRKNIHMPGADASMGVSFDGGRNKVTVSAYPMCWSDGRINANSNVWIPQYWCERQFWQVCAQGNGKGRGHQIFGARHCQSFWISDS
jgi:hypothetical protein